MRHLATIAVALLLITLIGCGAESTKQAAPPTPPSGSAPIPEAKQEAIPETKPDAAAATLASTTEEKAAGVTVEIKSWDETLELVAKHKGKVVVLDLWSTSCKPCLDEFPNLVKLNKQFGGDKLICMSASCDFAGIKGMPPESYKEQVLEFLTKQEAHFPNVLLNVETDVLFEKLDLASNPAVYVFGKDGQIAKRFDNDNAKKGEDFTYEKNIIPFVEKLIAE